MNEIRHSLRTLARSPGFTLAALLALALGIGANTAVFSVIQGVLLRPLPNPNSDRLVIVQDAFEQQGMDLGPGCIADFLDWKARSRSFQTLDAFGRNRFTLTGDGETEQVIGLDVTASFFQTLDARPLLGRTFSSGEDQPGRPPTVVLGERLWRRRYASAPDIAGKPIALNGRPHTVIGVMPASFRFGPRDAEAWAILELTPPTRRGPFFLRGIARLRPGVTLAQANADMQGVAREVERANPKDYDRLRFPVMSLRESVVGEVRPLLWVLGGAVLLVLLIAVSNVANLMLARATARRRETAIRASLGASHGQLVRPFLVESMLLALAGGAAGTALAAAGVRALRWLAPPGLPRLDEIGIDAGVLGFTLSASLASAAVFGLAPVLAGATSTLAESLKAGARGTDARGNRARSILVVAQVALSVLLLIGAGLLIRSFNLLGAVPAGFHAPPERVLSLLVSPTGERYNDDRLLAAYWDRLLGRIRALPGVEAASIAVTMPPDRLAFTDGFEIQGKSPPSGFDNPAVPVPFVDRDYFRTLGIPLVRGRVFSAGDTMDSPRITVISETMARRFFSGQDPVGQRLKHGGRTSGAPYMEIVGVVGDVKYDGLGNEHEPVYYEPTSQVPDRPMWVLVRTATDALALAPTVRNEIRTVDPDVPIARVGSMRQALSESRDLPRFRSLSMTVFAAGALLLAAVGIYGVIAYSVTQRTQEFGIRMAVGATVGDVLRLVVGRGTRLAGLGIALGLVGALALSRVLKTILFGITPTDPLTFGSVGALLGAVAVLASLIPALRASRVDPVLALRQEQ
jgi:putative ABC transport system permease protein